ncbi:hypothetical protein GF324_13340, partial [bacterium]|nr:hypothetical protein [bacterium]
NPRFGDAAWVDETSNATCELVADLYREYGRIPDESIALALYTGIMTDTGRFRYGVNGPRALATAAGLVQQGADFKHAAEEVFYKKDIRSLKTFGEVLKRTEVEADGRVYISHLTLSETDVDTEGFIETLAGIEDAEVVILMTQKEDEFFKVSLRSNGRVNVSDLASGFGGGGHAKAAGCRLRGSFEDVYGKLLHASVEALG